MIYCHSQPLFTLLLPIFASRIFWFSLDDFSLTFRPSSVDDGNRIYGNKYAKQIAAFSAEILRNKLKNWTYHWRMCLRALVVNKYMFCTNNLWDFSKNFQLYLALNTLFISKLTYLLVYLQRWNHFIFGGLNAKPTCKVHS